MNRDDSMLANQVFAISSENDRLKAQLAELRKQVAADDAKMCQTLGKALGYPQFQDDQKNFPGATEADGVCTGDHVARTLAEEAAKRIVSLEPSVSDAAKEVDRVRSDRQYIIGFNAGWDEAIVQNLRFPLMLRKMWAGHEVQSWIDTRMKTARSCSAGAPAGACGDALRLAMYSRAIVDIAFSDDVDNALDPERNKRVARAAIGSVANGTGPEAPPFTFSYRNYRGETSVRRVIPLYPRFGSNQWHTEPQWLLHAIDLDKGEEREFAMKDMAPATRDEQ